MPILTKINMASKSLATVARDDDLAELKCHVLESLREILVKNINPTKFLPYLRSKFVVDAYESDTIKNCCSKSVFEGADKLIDVLCTKGSKGYDEFCQAILHEETQIYLLKALNTRLEHIKHLKMKREREQREQERTIQRDVVVHPPSYVPGSAHTTTCVKYVQAPLPHQHFNPDLIMHSRSPLDPNHPPPAGENFGGSPWMEHAPDDVPCGQPLQ